METRKDENGIDLDNKEFQDILKLIRYTRQSVFMTGKAGAGKSTFLKYITGNIKKKHIVLAPTGIAAVNAGGVTLHSFFKIPFKPLLPDDPDFAVNRIRQRLKYTKTKQKIIKELELIIIDEISMVRADIIDFVDKVLRVYSGNMREPFGGKQLLLVGDIFQLEPVVTNDMRQLLKPFYPNLFFFSARVFEQLSVVPIELTKVYRQKDAAFVSLLDRFRIGQPTKNDFELLNHRGGVLEETGDFVVTLAAHRETVDAINDNRLAMLPAAEIVYQGEIIEDFPENSLPVPAQLSLKADAQVVFVRNDREHRWVNGTVGKIHKATKNMVEVELEDGSRHVVEPEVWENIVYEYNEKEKTITEKVIGTYTQYPLRLAWALTIHKSQGLTFNNVVLDFGRGTFAAGQAYVALSRCTSLEGITMTSPISSRDAIVNPAIVKFSKQFNDKELIEEALKNAEADDAYNKAAKAFDKGEMGKAVDLFLSAIEKNNKMNQKGARRLLAKKLSTVNILQNKVKELEGEIELKNQMLCKLAKEYVIMGYECLTEAGDITASLANFNKALSLDENNTDAMIGKSKTLLEAGQFEEAASEAERAHKINEQLLDAYLLMDKAYKGMEKPMEPFEIMLKALEFFAEKSVVHSRLAELYKSVGDEESAEKHRRIATRLKSKKQ